jgi:hypothetical protein
MDFENKGLNQLLLSPLHLFDQLLTTGIPGALFMLLLGLKGNVLIRILWDENVLGYKTKIAAFCVLAFVVGRFVKLPLNLLMSLRTKDDTSNLSEHLKKQSPEVRAMLMGMFVDGALLAMPGLVDRLSVIKANAGFYVSSGMAFLLAAAFPGDGSQARCFEALLGLALLWVGVSKAKEYSKQTLATVGVGLASVVGKMTPDQLKTNAGILKLLLTGEALQGGVASAACTPAAPDVSTSSQSGNSGGEIPTEAA